jgi:hypothetical protein
MKHLSASGLELLQMCGEAFRRRYIERERRPPPSVVMAIGKATHATAEVDLTYKRDAGALLADDDLPDLAADAFEKQWEDETPELNKEEKARPDATKAEAKDQTIALCKVHHSKLAPKIDPFKLEERLEVELDGYPYDLVAWLDVVESDGGIRDLKTRKRAPNTAQTIQAELYVFAQAAAKGILAPKFYMDVLVKTKTPKAVTLAYEPKEDQSPIERRLERAAKVIQADAFMPADPGHWKCSEKFCEFWDDCPWGRRRKIAMSPGGW